MKVYMRNPSGGGVIFSQKKLAAVGCWLAVFDRFEGDSDGVFNIRIGTETSYSKNFMQALYNSELISSEGKILFDYSY